MNQNPENSPEVEVEPINEVNSRIFTKKRVALGLTFVLLAQNMIQNSDALEMGASFLFSGGSMVPEVAGCEYGGLHELPATGTVPKNNSFDTDSTTTTLLPPDTTNHTHDEEKKAKEEKSSAKNNNWLQVIKNTPEFFFKQKNELYDHKEIEFVSQYSGIKFEIYNTGEEPERVIDPEVLDELFHFSLTTEVNHANPKIYQLMECVSEKVIEDRVLEGESVKIIIPSTADYCISNWLLKRVSDSEDNDCTQTGAALPKIELEFLNFKPYSEEYFFLTAGDISAESQQELNTRINRMFLHESIHKIFYMLGVTPRKDPDEQIVKYLENVLTMNNEEAKSNPFNMYKIKTSVEIESQDALPEMPEAIHYFEKTKD